MFTPGGGGGGGGGGRGGGGTGHCHWRLYQMREIKRGKGVCFSGVDADREKGVKGCLMITQSLL